ncbi:EpsG family protein [Erysipelothrix inopinata]|uniref:EpsG family protein n=1 Tax=Erysipelothrix inopinata TaxID=225084 RepID=A0A7G9S0S8_9FIRM|nr:EpsG family protein [Erysipelothrix inopinata]QNN61453.1 EpsG family protein [Erysipelothrix inopinata]
MRVIMESIFDIIYLLGVVGMGIYLLKNSKNKVTKLYGWMAVILGAGDAFHLIPRVIALLSAGPNGDLTSAFIQYEVSMGFGKAVTSITMTVFYLILYIIWKEYYQVKNTKTISIVLLVLAAVRIIVGLFPQNMWLVHNQPLDWAIYRNIPFAIMGIIMIYLFYNESRKRANDPFKWMWLAITLSFGFYIPVVLWSDVNQAIGLLMIPKTLAYVWVVVMGLQYQKSLN